MLSPSLHFKIYYVASGFGLAKDADILKANLAALGHECKIVELKPANLRYSYGYKIVLDFLCKFNLIFLYKKLQRMLLGKSSRIAIHLEKIFVEKLFLNEFHILIPNQEWVDAASIAQLQSLDAIWCKSKIANNTFRELHPATEYIGFCSNIGGTVSTQKDRSYFFSRIGRSLHRGGNLLIDVWRRHPEWPVLKIVMHSERRPQDCPANVECLDIITNPESYAKLSSSSQFHIYMSETEGFGHTIVEALGYGATVLVTDAPPMNEVANSSCALMVDAKYAGHKMLATRFAAVPDSLEKAVERALSMNEQELEQRCSAAKNQYKKLQQEFQENLARAVQTI